MKSIVADVGRLLDMITQLREKRVQKIAFWVGGGSLDGGVSLDEKRWKQQLRWEIKFSSIKLRQMDCFRVLSRPTIVAGHGLHASGDKGPSRSGVISRTALSQEWIAWIERSCASQRTATRGQKASTSLFEQSYRPNEFNEFGIVQGGGCCSSTSTLAAEVI